MASVVEARSLTSLLDSANSPPLHPPSPFASTEPLVLYIARVPGSKDVFLTPLKPRQKVVSAPDIESCLYYCHVESSVDEEVRSHLSSTGSFQDALPPPRELTLSNPDGSGLAQRRQQQLPYPDTGTGLDMSRPRLHNRDSDSLTPGVNATVHQGNVDVRSKPSNSIRRKPVGTGGQRSPEALIPLESPSSPQKILGPRPMLPPRPSSEATQLSPLSRSPGKENVKLWQSEPWSEQRSSHALQPPRNLNGGKMRSSVDGGLAGGFDRLSPFKELENPKVRVTGRATLITLIRRDPGSGEQWNVGRLEVARQAKRSRGVSRSSTDAEDSGAGVLLEITNSGYEKFIDTQHKQQQHQNTGDIEETITAPPFTRWLNFKKPKSPSHPSDCQVPPSRNGFRSSLDFRRSSIPSIPQQPLLSPSGSQTLSPMSNNLPPYTFLTPWNTTCAFSTGLAGKSLKCRHLIPSRPGLGPGLHAPNAPSHIRHQPKQEGPPVSELRFNLPGTTLPFRNAPATKRPQLPPSSASSRSSLHILGS
ncbi:MAG: hypothetical protein LQ340_001808, partial [Diploschistes diacapsis]